MFWAERITPRRRLGCSPYFAVTGTHPLIPLDIVEATYLLPPPDSVLSSTDLLARRALALRKRHEDIAILHSRVYASRHEAALRFGCEHEHTIRNFNFERGRLVLVRNTAIEKALNRKMRPRYLGPLIVLGRNRGGAYLLCELDGTVLDRPVAAFRVVPYFAREAIEFPDSVLDVSPERIRAMMDSTSLGDDDPFDEESPRADSPVPPDDDSSSISSMDA